MGSIRWGQVDDGARGLMVVGPGYGLPLFI